MGIVKRCSLAGCLFTLGLLLVACNGGPAAVGPSEPATIVVSEVGSATAPPDTLTVNFGINTRAASASEALGLNNQRKDALIRVLRDRGVEETTVDPRQLSVYPNSDPSQTQITEYEAVNQVVAKSKKLTDAGPLIDAAVAVAPDAIRVLGITHEVDSKSAVYASARKDALTRARERAESLASAAGVKLGRLVAVKETEGEFPVPPFYEDRQPAEEGEEKAPEDPGAGGGSETEITLQLTAVYEIED
jgi:uncharacterized protein YggE